MRLPTTLGRFSCLRTALLKFRAIEAQSTYLRLPLTVATVADLLNIDRLGSGDAVKPPMNDASKEGLRAAAWSWLALICQGWAMTLRGEAGEIVNDPRAQEPAVGLRSPEPESRPLACLASPRAFELLCPMVAQHAVPFERQPRLEAPRSRKPLNQADKEATTCGLLRFLRRESNTHASADHGAPGSFLVGGHKMQLIPCLNTRHHWMLSI